jgi:hypothetical protein
LANTADVEIVDCTQPADLVLRSPDDVAVDGSVDVTLAGDVVVVTLWGPPEPIVWEALGRLVGNSFIG